MGEEQVPSCFRSGDCDRLRSHSAIKLEAVRVSFEGASFVMAGQGIPSDALSSWVDRQSPKLDDISIWVNTVRENKGRTESNRNLPRASPGTAVLGRRRLIVLRGQGGVAG